MPLWTAIYGLLKEGHIKRQTSQALNNEENVTKKQE
jgi:hypothetical protein